MSSGIYQIRNLVDNKRYYGSTNNFCSRKAKHYSELRNNEHGNPRLQNAWNKHGESNFVFEKVEETEESMLLEVEQKYLNEASQDKENVYNINFVAGKGPDRTGIPQTLESNRKRSQTLAGHPVSEETKKKISDSRKGISFSEETKVKMSDAKKGTSPWNKGKCFSEKREKKIMVTCVICEQGFENNRGLASHVQVFHNLTTKEYTIKHLLNNVEPTCLVCGKEVRYVSFAFKRYCKEHAKVGFSDGGSRGGKNKKTWNRGKTKEDDSRIMQYSIKYQGEGNPFYGKKHPSNVIDFFKKRNLLSQEEIEKS